MNRTSAIRISSKRKKYFIYYLMAFPALLYFFVNNYIPMSGLFIAFKKINYAKGLFASPWVGFKNFRFLFATSDAWLITRNTLGYNLMFIVVGLILNIALAVFLNELRSKKALRVYQTCLLSPQLISMVIVSYLVFGYLSAENGFMNKFILPLLGREPVQWYNEPSRWPLILLIVNQWKNIGFGSVFYLSTIVGIDNELYESASLDGASKWKQFLYITLPFLKPTAITLTLMNLGRIFNSDFGLFFQVPMQVGALYETTSTIDTYVYRGLMQLNDISMASAAGAFQSVVGFITVLLANAVVRKIDNDQALF